MTYPDAITNEELVTKVIAALSANGYEESKTLLATSLCCDEVNRVLEKDFAKVYGDNFSMGGLAGFPFGGTTSFGAMAHHIPHGGSCFIVYGPHVGVSESLEIGKLSRRGLDHSGSCCGSACAALAYVRMVSEGVADETPMPIDDPIEMQQWLVGKLLLAHEDRLQRCENPMAELPMALFDEQVKLMENIVRKGCSQVASGTIALLGGIQINTPDGTSDYFLPLKFELFNNQGELIKDLMWK